jgi:hypothetical protein
MNIVSGLTLTMIACIGTAASRSANAEALNCDTSGYRSQQGLTLSTDGNEIVASWTGDATSHLRLRMGVMGGAPIIRDLSIQGNNNAWVSVMHDAVPDFSVTTGLRRMSGQQLQPLNGLGVKITQEVLDQYRWDPFWDAPLDLGAPTGRGNPPPAAGLPGTDQPGLPRSPTEIQRSDVRFAVSKCSVKTDGARMVIELPGLSLGVFSGKLQYTIFRGTNMVRQEVVASTSHPWVAYKFSAGLRGLSIDPTTRVRWRDISGQWQENKLGGAVNANPVPLAASNRLVTAETGKASLSLFPEPHRFFWSREIAINMGYNWYRKDAASSYSIGVRQNDKEDDSENQANWALYSARPGSEQRMPVFLYPTLTRTEDNVKSALAFTHGDTYKPMPGYQVMNHHYHMDLGQRLIAAGNLDFKLPDLVALKALGINIVSQIDSVILQGFSDTGAPAAPTTQAQAAQAPARPAREVTDQLAVTAASVAGANIHSDSGFLVLANQEIFDSPLGGHTDVLFSRPVYWDQRKPGQPFEETHPKYGKVYHIGDADDLMAMLGKEDAIVSMPHPRTKGSTGFPDAVKDRAFYKDSHYDGVGMRWGMGLDGSERRLCDFRCWPLLDDISNWSVDEAGPMKHILSISEVRHMQPGDDIYGSQPVTYVKLAKLPTSTDASSLIKALQAGDSYWTTGEVLVSNYKIVGSGVRRTVVADVEWTFPLDFVEVVWGDGKTTGRQIIPTTDLLPNGSKHFEIPFSADGKKWVRFAAWDNAANGAVMQPVRLVR